MKRRRSSDPFKRGGALSTKKKRQGCASGLVILVGIILVGISNLTNPRTTRQPITTPNQSRPTAAGTIDTNARSTWAAGTADALQATRGFVQLPTRTTVPVPVLSTDDPAAASADMTIYLQSEIRRLTSVIATPQGDGWSLVLNVNLDELRMEAVESVRELALEAVGVITEMQVITASQLWTWRDGSWRLDVAQVATVTSIPVRVVPTIAPTARATRTVVLRQQSSGSEFTCPRNCDGAVAMGLSPQQAAACGLDRDGDGVACYGD